MSLDIIKAVSRLKAGKSPEHEDVLNEITVGINYLTEFWDKHYLADYIPYGGSRIQFITGGMGSGKSHVVEYFINNAVNYKVVSFSARKIWLHDFKEIFFEVLRQCDLEDCLQKCANIIISEMGYSDADFDGNFLEYLATQSQNDPITKREIRQQLNCMFMQNPLMDSNFAFTCALLTGGLLGHPILEEPAREALLGWLSGSKEVKLSTLRNLGLSPVRIAKHHARHMLRSLVEVIKISGYKGLIIAIDDLDILVSKDSLEELRYTRQKRDDVYESLRELIDEIDTLRNVFFLFAFDRKLIDNDVHGFKSYQALWLRMQNEIKSDRVNLFSSMIDLDTLPIYDVETIIELSERVARIFNSTGELPAKQISEHEAKELISKTVHGESSLPRNVILATLGQSEEN